MDLKQSPMSLIEQPSASHFSSSTDPSDPSPLNPSKTSSTTTKGASNVPVTAIKHSPTRGFSFHSLAFLSNNDHVKPALSTVQVHKKEAITSAAFFKHQAKVPKADKQARDSALIVRSLIIGEVSVYPASLTASGGISKPQLSKVKTQLMQPDSANKLIAQLRSLSGSGGQKGAKPGAEHKPEGPIHAICLDTTDVEAEKRYFSRLTQGADADKLVVSSPSVANASIDQLANMFKDMHIVSLIKSPDFGLGQPGDGDGILSGAVPTASTIINGIEQITRQLMALGFMAGKAVLPDHEGVCPPTDRISVLTYWWGLEVVIPASSLHYLSNVQSIAHTMINILTVMSVMNGGVREILPFVRYISQFIDFEFNAIQNQNKGQGVVCAATWIMPAAMVPRPWDFAPAATGDNIVDPTAPSAELLRSSQVTYHTSRPSGSRLSNSRAFDVTAGPSPTTPSSRSGGY